MPDHTSQREDVGAIRDALENGGIVATVDPTTLAKEAKQDTEITRLTDILAALTPGGVSGITVSQGDGVIASDEGAWFFRLALQPGDVGTSTAPLFTSTPSPLVDSDAGTVTKKLVLTGAGRKLRGFIVTNNQVTAYYFQIHSKATAPVATDVPFISFLMPAASSLVVGASVLSDQGVDVALGLGWAWSSTANTFTDAGTAGLHTTAVLYG